MRKRKDGVKPDAEEKVLDVNASMQGTLRFDDPVNLRINGKFEGNLSTKGKLMVGQKANIKADIVGEEISIAGNVTGNIKASSSLKLESTAKLLGDISTPKIEISGGAVLDGHLTMSKSGKDISGVDFRGDWMTTEQLSKYLEVDLNKINDWVTGGMLPGTKEGGEWIFEKTKIDQWIADGKVKA